MAVTLETARMYANKYKIDLRKVPLKYFRKGLQAELEHRNITHGDLDLTTKIVIAHLEEFPDYYQRLEILEDEAKLFWKNNPKNIFRN